MPRCKQAAREQRSGNARSALEGRAVYVRGIPPEWSTKRLREFFHDRWNVESVNLLPKKEQQQVQAAFINFVTAEDAADAVEVCDNHFVNDSAGQVFWLGCSIKKALDTRVDIVRVSNENPSEILDGFLFLGNIDNAKRVCQEALLGIDHILSALVEPPEDPYRSWWEEISTCSGVHKAFFRVDDVAEQDLSACFLPACEFLEQARLSGARVLVHCLAGRSRSASIVLAYLMRCHGMNLHDSFMLVKEKRLAALPNAGFWEQLRGEEMRIFGKLSSVPANYKALENSEGKADISGILSVKAASCKRARGVCKEWHRQYGYVEAMDDGQSVFLHCDDLFFDTQGKSPFQAGCPVSFQYAVDEGGHQPRAVFVTCDGTREEELLEEVQAFAMSDGQMLDFPPHLTPGLRRVIHCVAQKCGLTTRSEGEHPNRFVRISKASKAPESSHGSQHVRFAKVQKDARSEMSVQLAPGSLGHAACPRLLHDLRCDLHHFSGLKGVHAHMEARQDKIAVVGCASHEHIVACRSELEQILSFYGFVCVQWSPAACK